MKKTRFEKMHFLLFIVFALLSTKLIMSMEKIEFGISFFLLLMTVLFFSLLFYRPDKMYLAYVPFMFIAFVFLVNYLLSAATWENPMLNFLDGFIAAAMLLLAVAGTHFSLKKTRK